MADIVVWLMNTEEPSEGLTDADRDDIIEYLLTSEGSERIQGYVAAAGIIALGMVANTKVGVQT
jgi:hypothetical protein